MQCAVSSRVTMTQQAARSRAVLWSGLVAIVALQLLVWRVACPLEPLRTRVQTWSRSAIGALKGVPINKYVGPEHNPPCFAPMYPYVAPLHSLTAALLLLL